MDERKDSPKEAEAYAMGSDASEIASAFLPRCRWCAFATDAAVGHVGFSD